MIRCLLAREWCSEGARVWALTCHAQFAFLYNIIGENFHFHEYLLSILRKCRLVSESRMAQEGQIDQQNGE